MSSLLLFLNATVGPGYTLLSVLHFSFAPLSYRYTWYGNNSFKDFGSLRLLTKDNIFDAKDLRCIRFIDDVKDL